MPTRVRGKKYTFEENPRRVTEKPREKTVLIFTIKYTAEIKQVNTAALMEALEGTGKVEIVSVETATTTENLVEDYESTWAPEDSAFNWDEPDDYLYR